MIPKEYAALCRNELTIKHCNTTSSVPVWSGVPELRAGISPCVPTKSLDRGTSLRQIHLIFN